MVPALAWRSSSYPGAHRPTRDDREGPNLIPGPKASSPPIQQYRSALCSRSIVFLLWQGLVLRLVCDQHLSSSRELFPCGSTYEELADVKVTSPDKALPSQGRDTRGLASTPSVKYQERTRDDPKRSLCRGHFHPA